METLERFINFRLLSAPMNWAIVAIFASIWLLFFHTVMQGFSRFQTAATGGPSLPGTIEAPAMPPPSGNLGGDIGSTWGDDFEARWSEDTASNY